ncbi:MAG: diguanylate cyclase [Candidatus Omnitrophica bacterium]|nr:diguanylate cyclase [Candidatus Omnitrophota bacterium]
MDRTKRPIIKKISEEKEEIVSRWIENIQSLAGSYSRADPSELRGFCTEFFDAFIKVVKNNNFSQLRIFIEKLCNIRSSQGFRLSEVQRAYYSFYDIIKLFIEKLDFKEKDERSLLELINNVLVDTMIELSESYHRELNEKIDSYVDQIENINLKLKDRSIKDELTGCYNHRYFQDILTSEISRAVRYNRPLSIIMFDIDHFKKINDKYGHTFGDKVLKGIGDILKKTVRGSDMVFRYGGEEFCVILPETDKERAFIGAERIRKKISTSAFRIKNKVLKVTVSGGINGFVGKEITKETFIDNADKVLYQAKNAGRNRVAIYRKKEISHGI